MEKKNNGGLITVIFILTILVLALVGYIAYDKGLIFNNNIEESNKENTEKEDNEDVNKEDVIEQSVPTDMSLVSSKLDELGLNIYVMRMYSNWNSENLLSDSSNKLNLLNVYFVKNNLTISGCDNQCAVISLETYKNKYAELYGSLDNFEYDTNNTNKAIFSVGDGTWNISNDYVYWNQVYGISSYNVTLEATSVTYDEDTKNYVIDGNMMAIQDGNSIGSKGTFKITYVNDGIKNYLTGITITSTEN